MAFVERVWHLSASTLSSRCTRQRLGIVVANGASLCGETTKFMKDLWRHATLPIVCADGGLNRLYEWQRLQDVEQNQDQNACESSASDTLAPTVVVGDFDSTTQLALDYYRAHRSDGVDVIRDSCQNRNDLQKSMELFVGAKAASSSSSSSSSSLIHKKVVVLGAIGGSFMHSLSNVNVLFGYVDRVDIVLVGPHSVASLLGANTQHRIIVDVDAAVGLFPIGGACRSVTTEGLEWNLSDQRLEFGGLVSSSNRALASQLSIHSSDPLLLVVDR
jgi:thiamine pyrophosphokinase